MFSIVIETVMILFVIRHQPSFSYVEDLNVNKFPRYVNMLI